MAKCLKARVHILYGGKQYKPGDFLPANNPAYVSAWIQACSAVWTDESDSSEEAAVEKPIVKAQPKTAPAGVTGIAQPATGTDEDLVGRVPRKEARGVKKEKSKRPAKSQA